MIRIAISGKAGSGKDTLGNILWSEFAASNNLPITQARISTHGYTNIRKKITRKNIAFADPIKEMILLMFPQVKREYLFGSSHYRSEPIPSAFKDGQPLTIRKLLQDLGEGCKQYNPKIWINAFNDTYQQEIKNNTSLVIASDLRFIDEFSYLKENEFYIIRLLKEEVTHINHVSETQQAEIKDSDFDKVIYNNLTIEDLRLQAQEIVKMLKS